MHAPPIVLDVGIFLLSFDVLLGGLEEVGVRSLGSAYIGTMIDVQIML
jgi:hypothetical protein